MEACQGECTYAGNRTDRLVDKSEQIHQTGSKPAEDDSMEPLQSGGRSRAKAKNPPPNGQSRYHDWHVRVQRGIDLLPMVRVHMFARQLWAAEVTGVHR